MPELPEVETIARQLRPLLGRREVVEAWAFPSPKYIDALDLVGTTLEGPRRLGKYLLFDARPHLELPHLELVVHLGMTGSLGVGTSPLAPDPHRRAWWRFEDGAVLWYRDIRRFGRTLVVPAGDHRTVPTLHTQGPDPWDPELTDEVFRQRLRASRRRVKTQLLSQRPVAGVGNIYADEALWEAGVHPGLRRITGRQATALLAAIRRVLEEAIEHGGTTLRDYRDATGATGTNQHHLRCYGRAGRPCERCGTTLVAVVYDARTTTYCPDCQRRRPTRDTAGRPDRTAPAEVPGAPTD